MMGGAPRLGVLGSLMVEVGASVARLQRDLGQAKAMVQKGARKIKRAAATIGVALSAAFAIRGIKNFIAAGIEAGSMPAYFLIFFLHTGYFDPQSLPALIVTNTEKPCPLQ